jgi:hypothetical protein
MENLIQTSEESVETQAQEQTSSESSSTENSSTEKGDSSEQPKYDIEGFNKYFGSSFEDESSLKQILSSSQELEDYKSRFSSLESELTEAKKAASNYNEFIDYFKPENFYGDEETWKFVETRKKFRDKDPDVVHRIQSNDFNSLSDIDKLILADKLKVPGNISDDVRKQGVLKKLGIETEDLSELSTLDRYAIASAVADQKALFDEIRNFKPEPMKFDIVAEKEKRDKQKQEKVQELQKRWQPLASSLMKNYKEAKAFTNDDKGNSVEIFKYSAGEDFQKNFFEPFMATIIKSGMEPTEKNVQAAADYLDQQFKIQNFDRIVNEAIKHGKTLSAEATHKEIHNDKPQNQNEAPPRSGEGQALTLKEWAKRRRVSQNKE